MRTVMASELPIDAMRSCLENIVEALLKVRVPLVVTYDFMRDEFIVACDGDYSKRVSVAHRIALDAAFGQRVFNSRRELDSASLTRRVIAQRVAQTIGGGR